MIEQTNLIEERYLGKTEVFAHDASFETVKAIFDQDYKYENVNHLITFIDNHDRDRFLCLADDNYQKLRLAASRRRVAACDPN